LAAGLPLDFLPKVSLLLMMFLAMTFDFITGIAKAYVLKQKITSKALRRTVIKFSQYGGAILIGLGLSYMSREVGTFNETWKYAPKFMNFFNNSLLVFIITIETRSIVENITAMDRNSRFAKGFLYPALRILDIQIKNKSVAQVTIETDEDDDIEIKHTKVQSKNVVK
jgi:hypothetical protein